MLFEDTSVAYFNAGETPAFPVSKFSVQFSVADGFGDVFALDIVAVFEVGDGSGDFADFVVGAGAQAEFLHRLLQEHFACFAANFVRFAALWIAEQQVELAPVNTTPVKQVELTPTNMASVKQVESAPINTASVKHMVQVCAHTSAWVMRQGDVWLLTFTEQSLYAGYSLRFGIGPVQLPLPLAFNIHSCNA